MNRYSESRNAASSREYRQVAVKSSSPLRSPSAQSKPYGLRPSALRGERLLGGSSVDEWRPTLTSPPASPIATRPPKTSTRTARRGERWKRPPAGNRRGTSLLTGGHSDRRCRAIPGRGVAARGLVTSCSCPDRESRRNADPVGRRGTHHRNPPGSRRRSRPLRRAIRLQPIRLIDGMRLLSARSATSNAAYHAPRSGPLNRAPSGWAWQNAALMT